MTQEKLSALVEENMKTIFAYALSRVSHKEDAEDLAGDIILAILANGTKIRDDNAFFGYIWSIASNTYKKFLRRRSRTQYELLDEELADGSDFIREILKSQEYNVLRRELALLSREYRECTVAYYFEGLSCAETASRLHISLEMVKYYLFKTRKILKEGIVMEREFGTKSYNPAKFEFATVFSERCNAEYSNLFSRKLPGNILVSAYYTPMTIRELAIEMGVASVYLEDEIALLEKYHLLTPLPGGKYQTHLLIFTEEYQNEFFRTAEKTLTADMGLLLSHVKERLPEIQALAFPGAKLDEAHLLWSFLFELIRMGWNLFFESEKIKKSEIYTGATGINAGYTYERHPEADERNCHGFAGYCKISGHYAASYADFGVIPPKNRPSSYFKEWRENPEVMPGCCANPPIPVVTARQKESIEAILHKEIEEMAKIYQSLYNSALAIMKVHAPASISSNLEEGGTLANSLLFDTTGLIGFCAAKSGELPIPDDNSPLGTFLYENDCAL